MFENLLLFDRHKCVLDRGVVSYKTDALRQTDRARPSLYQSKSYQLLQNCRNKLYNKSTTNPSNEVKTLRSTDV